MKHTTLTEWKKQMNFASVVDDFTINMDAALEFGGNNMGTQPKKLMLVALTGCTGMDVVSILSKMKVYFDKFQVYAEAELSEEHPRFYTKVHLVYEIFGKNIDKSKVEKAINLSQEKYCGVSYMFRFFAQVTYDIRIHETS